MIYLPELYYFFDQKDFPFEKAFLVTAKTVSSWCTYYKVELICPVKDAQETKRQGGLPQDKKEKQLFIKDLVKWIFSNSEIQDSFAMFLDNSKLNGQEDKPLKFDHHDDTCCWTLNLTNKEFVELQSVWKSNGLPEDLFYKEREEIKIIKANGFIGRFLVKLGFTIENSKIYSPKRWEEEKRKEFAAPPSLKLRKGTAKKNLPARPKLKA